MGLCMQIDYSDYINLLTDFFKARNWEYNSCDGNVVFTKKYSNAVTRKIRSEYLLSDTLFYSKVSKSFAELGIPSRISSSLENKNSDTDFIIAGLQLADADIKQEYVNHTSFYSLQPVVRLTKSDMGGQQDGMLTSFVNICSVDINTSLEEYLKRVDQWISIFSKLSLHTSGFKLTPKKIKNDRKYNGVPFYNGLKLKFSYKDTDIAVANLFTVDCAQGSILVSDFGSSYERVLGCINGDGNFFKPIYPNFQVLYGDYRRNDRLRTSVLMCLSGIVPGAKGNGQKLRDLIKEATVIIGGDKTRESIIYFYNYYAKFIKAKKSLAEVIYIIEAEMEQQKKKLICGKNDNRFAKKSINDVCGDIILEREILKRKRLITKSK